MRRKKNIILENVLIEDYAAEGKSLARVDGKVIFVENLVPGDVADLRLTKNKKDWAEAVLHRMVSSSPERVQAFCQHFGVCGGCQWQMLPYEMQLQYKEKQVIETLRRIGKINLPVHQPILGAEETKFYRNKLEYTFSNKEFTIEKPERKPPPAPRLGGEYPTHNILLDENAFVSSNVFSTGEASAQMASPSGGGRVGALGFHPKGFFDKVVDIQKCWLQPEPTNALRLAVKQFAAENNYPFYDIRNHTGFMRTMQVRICSTGEVMVNIVFAHEDKEKRNTLLEHIRNAFPEITTLLYTINQKWNDSMHDLEPIVYHGKGYIIEKLSTGEEGGDFEFKIGPKSFFQTNTRQAEKLYRCTKDFAELTGRETVYDLYCGTGSIGIFLSRAAGKIIGVETIEAAVEDARENALLNNLKHTEFYTGDVIDICNDSFFEHHGRPDVIITDPPRAGMHEKLVKKILEIEAPLVVYVSCNPASQARDLSLLAEKYAVTRMQPVDMFPHTHHIENVVQLRLR